MFRFIHSSVAFTNLPESRPVIGAIFLVVLDTKSGNCAVKVNFFTFGPPIREEHVSEIQK